MFHLTVSGYTSGELKVEDSDYGKRGTLSLRASIPGKKQQNHYVNAVFYGKKIETAQKYIQDGRQITITGQVRTILCKRRKDESEYVSIYVDVSEFTLPERLDTESSGSPMKKGASDDDMGF